MENTTSIEQVRGLTLEDHQALLDLYTTARDAWGTASRFPTYRLLESAHNADTAFTDALQAKVTT